MNPIKTAAAATLAAATVFGAGDWGTLHKMHDYEKSFGLTKQQQSKTYKTTILRSNADGNVFHPGEQPKLEVQVESLTGKALKGEMKFEVIHYSQYSVAGDQWWPRIVPYGVVDTAAVPVALAGKSWENITVSLEIPETKGGYAVIAEFPGEGRSYVTSMIRTFTPDPSRVQYPKQALDPLPGPILKRIGVKSLRFGVKYIPSDSKKFKEYKAWLADKFKEYHDNNVTLTVEYGSGHEGLPMGINRPHLDDKGFMKTGKKDASWLPSQDPDFHTYVYDMISEYGWPKGPITSAMLWNEPWESRSISGWQADIPRYREIYKTMGDAIFKARKDADVDVLVGGCDSTDNTIDKLFGDGSDDFLPYLDFCSVHYQNLNILPRYMTDWINRPYHKGRVLVWDTESWVANTDDTFAGAVAAMRAAGYDRTLASLGRIAVSTLSHNRIAHDYIQTEDGKEKIERWIECRPLAAAYGAVQEFIGERDFEEILFKQSLPWIYTFKGMNNNPDDGTVVIVGDIAAHFTKKGMGPLFNGVRCLDEIKAKADTRKQLEELAPSDSATRIKLLKELDERSAFTNASFTIAANPKYYGVFDFYGNPVKVEGDNISIPLNHLGFFLRANKDVPGSFAMLKKELKEGTVEGIEPLEIIAKDMTSPIKNGSSFRLRLTNQYNRPISGNLSIKLGDLKLAYPKQLSFEAHQRTWVDVNIIDGKSRSDNMYCLSVEFDTKDTGKAVHNEELHVNFIQRKTPSIDGDLSDWKDAIPQIVSTDEGNVRSFAEEMWAMGAFKAGKSGGFARAFVAHDDDYFYFAAQIADNDPHPGSIRYAERDDDSFYYPEVSYDFNKKKSMTADLDKLHGDAARNTRELLKDESGKTISTMHWISRGETMGINFHLAEETAVTFYYRDPSTEFKAYDADSGKRLWKERIKIKDSFAWLTMNLKGNVRLEFKPRRFKNWRESGIYGIFFDEPAKGISNKKPILRDNTEDGKWKGKFGSKGKWIAGLDSELPEDCMAFIVNEVIDEFKWPEGVRHFSYRRGFDCPWNYNIDNVLIAFNALPLGQDGVKGSLPGNMPRYAGYSSTDHEFVFNKVAEEFGGGYETWRLKVPGMKRIHFFPRQPKHPLWGSVENAKMAVKYENGFRYVEVALPWSEIPAVKLLRDTGKPVKFAFRINDSEGPTLENGARRSICEGFSGAFHPGWRGGFPNELEFTFE